jgi:hypothetical protein
MVHSALPRSIRRTTLPARHLFKERAWFSVVSAAAPGPPADVVLRMLILKHLFDWSYDDLEREVRADLVDRRVYSH